MVKNRSISYLTHKKRTVKNLLQDKLLIVPKETTHSLGRTVWDAQSNWTDYHGFFNSLCVNPLNQYNLRSNFMLRPIVDKSKINSEFHRNLQRSLPL